MREALQLKKRYKKNNKNENNKKSFVFFLRATDFGKMFYILKCRYCTELSTHSAHF